MPWLEAPRQSLLSYKIASPAAPNSFDMLNRDYSPWIGLYRIRSIPRMDWGKIVGMNVRRLRKERHDPGEACP